MDDLKSRYLSLGGTTIYDTVADLDESWQKLIELAKLHCSYSYSPYSNFAVGAGLLLENGKLIGGSNQENASYPLCICAERTGLCAASSIHPGVAIQSMAITAFKKDRFVEYPISPCGSCRQFIAEFANRYNQDIEIILYSEEYTVVIDSIYRLLPVNFESKDLT